MARFKRKQSFAFRVSDDYGHFSNSCLFWCSLTQPHCVSENEVWCAAHQTINFLERARRDCARINLFTDLSVFIIIFGPPGCNLRARRKYEKEIPAEMGHFYVTFYSAGDASGILRRRSLSRLCYYENNKEIRGFARKSADASPAFFLTHKQAGWCRWSCFFFSSSFFSPAIVLKETL